MEQDKEAIRLGHGNNDPSAMCLLARIIGVKVGSSEAKRAAD